MKTIKWQSIVIAGVIISAIFIYFNDTKEEVYHRANAEVRQIQNQVTADAVQQYEITARQGDLMQMYSQAGMVTACFLQDKDEANYGKWKRIEDSLGRRLGMPVYR